MQGAFLRVFVVALGLVTYQKDDLRVDQRADLVMEDMQLHEERLLMDEGQLEQERTYVIEEVQPKDAHNEQNDPIVPNQSLSTIKSPSVGQCNSLPLAENSTGEKRGHAGEGKNIEPSLIHDGTLRLAEADLTLPKECKVQLETHPKIPKIESKDQAVLADVKSSLKLKADLSSQICTKREDTQRRGYFWDLNVSQGQEGQLDLEVLSSRREVPPADLLAKTSGDNLVKTTTDWDSDYLWYSWNALSIISIIRFLRKCLMRSPSHRRHDFNSDAIPVKSISRKVPLPDGSTLERFHARCIQLPPNKKRRVGEFLEGFTNDLVQVMRTTGDGDVGMVIEGFQMVEGSCEIIVPFAPPKPYSFQCQLRSNAQGCGHVKMVRNEGRNQSGCHCETSSKGEEVLCLLHGDDDKAEARITEVYDGPLCMENTPFLSKSKVSKRFRSVVRQAWAQISHKYEFELKFHNQDALVVRFRSGKRMNFNMSPVVKLNNTDAYFFISPGSDISWTLSTRFYENHFLKDLSEGLPLNSCHIKVLEIAHFLHRKQTALTGECFLKELHFKTTLMHLLLTKHSSQWHPDFLTSRLRDLMALIEESLRRRLLRHLLIANRATQTGVRLPTAVAEMAPVNLFHPLAADLHLYTKTVKHFEETLKNADILIQEYASRK